MKYKVDDTEYEVIIQKKSNKNTYIRVKEDLKIYVTTNYFVSKNQLKELLNNNYEFIKNMIKKQETHNQKEEQFIYLGKKYDIIIMNNKNVEIFDDRIYVKSVDYLNKWYKKQMKELFEQRLILNYNQFAENIPFPILKIRTMKTRWGVCNKKTIAVTLNSELMKYSIDKLDYVIIHELSHFIHFNHSKEFWLLVSKYCPNYKKIRKELKEV